MTLGKFNVEFCLIDNRSIVSSTFDSLIFSFYFVFPGVKCLKLHVQIVRCMKMKEKGRALVSIKRGCGGESRGDVNWMLLCTNRMRYVFVGLSC